MICHVRLHIVIALELRTVLLMREDVDVLSGARPPACRARTEDDFWPPLSCRPTSVEVDSIIKTIDVEPVRMYGQPVRSEAVSRVTHSGSRLCLLKVSRAVEIGARMKPEV